MDFAFHGHRCTLTILPQPCVGEEKAMGDATGNPSEVHGGIQSGISTAFSSHGPFSTTLTWMYATAGLCFVGFQTAILKTTIDEHDAARVAQVLLESHRLALSNDADVDAAVVTAAAGSDDTLRDSNSKASRLRDDIFDLSVRELSSTIQARLLLELEGTDSELGGEKHFQLLCCDC